MSLAVLLAQFGNNILSDVLTAINHSALVEDNLQALGLGHLLHRVFDVLADGLHELIVLLLETLLGLLVVVTLLLVVHAGRFLLEFLLSVLHFILHGLLSLLELCSQAAGLRTAIYDPVACCADLLPVVLERCGDVSVVTDRFAPYYDAADCALEELGAAAVITRRRETLRGCALIIAPCAVEEPLPVGADAVTLTVCRPKEALGGSVFWHYRFRTPNGFADIKPDELSEEYFCSALYTLGAQYELGSIVPPAAQGAGESCDLKTLAKVLDKRRQKEYNI